VRRTDDCNRYEREYNRPLANSATPVEVVVLFFIRSCAGFSHLQKARQSASFTSPSAMQDDGYALRLAKEFLNQLASSGFTAVR
jgi:hypothetical protein